MGATGWIDAILVASYFAGTLALGLWIARRERHATLLEYSLGSRQVPGWAVLGSIIAAEISAATFLGAPAEGYKSKNFFYCQLAFGTILARIIVSRVFIGLYYRHRVESIYEFLQLRFGPCSKNAASLMFLIGRLLGIGVRLYLGGVIFVVIWRHAFQEEPSLFHYSAGIIAILALTTVYTALGGIKAVVYTDFLQFVLMASSAISALVALYLGLPDGWRSLQTALPEGARLFQLGPTESWGAFFGEPYTIFAALIGGTFLTMATHGTDQDMVQRMLTARTQRESRWSLILSGVVDLPIALGFSAIGILLWVHYRVFPDPRLPAQGNELFAHYIVTALPTGIRGLVLAGIFATIMGSTSAALNSLSVCLTKDWYLPYFRPRASDRELTRFARIGTAACALILAAIAVLAAHEARGNPALTIIPLALGLMGITYGSLLGVFLLGALTKKRGDDRANVVAMGFGILAVLLLQKVVAWPWYALVGTVATLAVAAPFRTPNSRKA